MEKDAVLVKLDEAKMLLAEAEDFHTPELLRTLAKGAMVILKARRDSSLESINHAAEIKIRAERRLGELLKEQPKAKPWANVDDGSSSTLEEKEQSISNETLPLLIKDESKVISSVEELEQNLAKLEKKIKQVAPPTLKEQNISPKQSSRWQQIANIPEENFEAHIAITKEAKKELTTASIENIGRLAKQDTVRTERLKETGNVEGKYFVIYADPPWKNTQTIHVSRSTEKEYPTEGVEAICDQKVFNRSVSDLVGEHGVLFLWVTCNKIDEAIKVIENWGFKLQSSFVWVKPSIGLGFWIRARHEILLFATRGKPPLPDTKARHDSVVEAPRGKHSEKPEIFYEIIEEMFPKVKKLELYSRNKREGWDSWGNE